MTMMHFPAAALALSLAAVPAFGSGADGPTFPNLKAAAVSDEAVPTTAMGAAAPAVHRAAPMLIAADTLADEAVFKGDPQRTRAEQQAEVLKANVAGELGHATTPY